jgi:hypothetical protein
MVKKDKEEKEKKFGLKSKIISKKIFKKNKMTITIPERKVESSWNDENRYFKGDINKRSLMSI